MDIVKIEFGGKYEIDEDYVVAIGNFDGVHQGHREVIKKARAIARDSNLKLAIMSFDITPRKLVNGIDNYYILRSFNQKVEIFEELDVDTFFLVKFDERMRNVEAEDFINDILIAVNTKYLVCGFDFAFGKDKKGTTKLLQEYSEFQTIVLPKASFNNKKIGSTLIHELILQGDIKVANELLVKPYSMIGKVIKGNQKGREIGFPTANLLPETNYRIPEIGVYATKVIIDGKQYYGMTNIGHNPTFNYRSNTSIETNIFDFDEDLYGKEIEVIFVDNIRKEKIFSDINSLVKQLEEDKNKIKELFNLT